jgi:CubicO group peptidase (beta-lactamase class C family)
MARARVTVHVCAFTALLTAVIATEPLPRPIASPSQTSSPTDEWDEVRAAIHNGVKSTTFPGAVALVADRSGLRFSAVVGNHIYDDPSTPQGPHLQGPLGAGDNPPMTNDTLFDLASLTKVISTTSAVMLLYERGHLALDTAVASVLGPAYSHNGKGSITVTNLLLHNAGFPPDPNPNYWDVDFKCPATVAGEPHPPQEFTCQGKIYAAMLAQPLDRPPGQKFVYSDLSMITMMYVVGTIVGEQQLVAPSDLLPACAAGAKAASNGEVPGPIAQCYYEAFVRLHVFKTLGMHQTGFLPAASSKSLCAPAWNDTAADAPGGVPYRHEVIQGYVSDGNSYALGGIAGHAGVFSVVSDVMTLARALLFPGEGGAPALVNASTIATFVAARNLSQSSRALGWDTNSYTANGYRGCGNLSQSTFTHTGYTGTEICCDRDNGFATVLLTNRVYPIANDESELKIHAARQAFNNAVLRVMKPLNPDDP